MLQLVGALSSASHYSWPSYHTNTELFQAYAELDSSCSALTLTKETESADGWPLMTAEYGSAGASKAKVMFVFGIHGREYLGAEIGLALMKKLCEKDDARVASLLEGAHFKFFPLMNPSGRAGNMPEKKISEDHGEECILRRTNSNGVDLNRNFNVSWNAAEGNGKDFGLVDWRGPNAESEIETQLLVAQGRDFSPDLYIDVHTGAFTMLTPYSCNMTELKGVKPEVAAAQMELLEEVQSGSESKFSEQPAKGQGSQLLYVATGTTMDFFFNEVGTPYAYTWETFDASVNGVESCEGKVVGEVSLDTMPPAWTPDMPAMRDYVARTRRERLQKSDTALRAKNATLPPAVAASAKGAAALAALQPERDSSFGEAPVKVVATQLNSEACFKFYNPDTSCKVEQYVNSWLEDILRASEHVVKKAQSDDLSMLRKRR